MSWFKYVNIEDRWVAFSQQMAQVIEKGYVMSSLMIDLDGDCFVDYKNMLLRKREGESVDGEVNSVIMGPVKRVEKNAMDGVVAMILGDQNHDLNVFVDSCGILVTPYLTKHVTHVICDPSDDLAVHSELLCQALEMGVPVVDKSFLIELVNATTIESIDQYLLSEYNHQIFKPFTEWIGIKSGYDNSQIIIKFTILLLNSESGQFWGEIKYPTTQNYYKINGQKIDNTITFREYGPHGIDCDLKFSEYTATVMGSQINGSFESGKFNLHFYNIIRDRNAPILHSNTTWNGFTTTEHPFKYKVKSIEKSEISGEINWLELDAITKYKGTIKSGTIQFEEYEHLDPTKSNTIIPKHYNGTIQPETATITGTYNTPTHSHPGTFKITLTDQ